jgi:alpha-amylase
MHYSAQHFSGVDYDASRNSNAIYKITGPNKKGWAADVDNELGNYDYLMFDNIDYAQLDVRRDVLNWGSWITEELGLSGFRLDAMKHYSQDFQKEFVKHMDSQFGRDFFFVGEYWKWDSFVLSSVIGKFKGRINLFDVQLVYNLSDISQEKQTDLRKVFDNALVQLHPQRAVVRPHPRPN